MTSTAPQRHWKAGCAMQLDDAVPHGELHCIHEATRSPSCFTVKVSNETWATAIQPRPYPLVAVPSAHVEGRDRPGIALAMADVPEATHADGASYNVMIAVSRSDCDYYRQHELLQAAKTPGDEEVPSLPGRLLLVLPEGWGEHGGIRWKRQAILMASAALCNAFDAAGVGLDHVYRNKLVQIDDDVERIGAIVIGGGGEGDDRLEEVPNFVLMAYLGAPFTAKDSTTIISAGIRHGTLRRWPGAKDARAVLSSHWRNALRCEQVTMIDIERLAGAPGDGGISFLQPTMLSWNAAEIHRQVELYKCEAGTDLTKHEDFDLCVTLGAASCALVQGLYVAELAGQVSAVTKAAKSRTTKVVYNNSNVAAIRRFAAPEMPPAFDADHYPQGVNHFFYNMSVAELEAKFGGKDGLFHSESRDIANAKLRLADYVVNSMLPSSQNHDDVQEDAPRYAVLELGCGTGLITEVLIAALALRAANEGPGATWHLMATEVSSGFVDLATQRLNKCVPAELLTAAGGAVDVMHHPPHCVPAVPTSSCDVCAIVDVYHHLEFPKTMMRDIRRALKPGGMLLLVDFHRDRDLHKGHPDDPEWVMKHVRGDQKTFTDEIVACGFENPTTVEIEGIKENYCVVFRRAAAMPAK